MVRNKAGLFYCNRNAPFPMLQPNHLARKLRRGYSMIELLVFRIEKKVEVGLELFTSAFLVHGSESVRRGSTWKSSPGSIHA